MGGMRAWWGHYYRNQLERRRGISERQRKRLFSQLQLTSEEVVGLRVSPIAQGNHRVGERGEEVFLSESPSSRERGRSG